MTERNKELRALADRVRDHTETLAHNGGVSISLKQWSMFSNDYLQAAAAILALLDESDAKDARIAELEKVVVDLREALGPFARINFKQRLLGAIGDRGDWDLETIDVQLRFLRKARKVYAQTSNAGCET